MKRFSFYRRKSLFHSKITILEQVVEFRLNSCVFQHGLLIRLVFGTATLRSFRHGLLEFATNFGRIFQNRFVDLLLRVKFADLMDDTGKNRVNLVRVKFRSVCCDAMKFEFSLVNHLLKRPEDFQDVLGRCFMVENPVNQAFVFVIVKDLPSRRMALPRRWCTVFQKYCASVGRSRFYDAILRVGKRPTGAQHLSAWQRQLRYSIFFTGARFRHRCQLASRNGN